MPSLKLQNIILNTLYWIFENVSYFHIRTARLDVIKVLFIHQLMN